MVVLKVQLSKGLIINFYWIKIRKGEFFVNLTYKLSSHLYLFILPESYLKLVIVCDDLIS